MAGLYLHIPFCRKACHYCNFHFSTSLYRKTEMIEAMVKEISNFVKSEALESLPAIESIYFGGGTPSLLTKYDFEILFQAIYSTFNKTTATEITLEANPDDINIEKLDLWKKMGFNRLSIGIQSFFDADLQWMNRAHNSQQARNCILLAQEMGFNNLSIDLIYGTPGLSNQNWQENLKRAIKLGIPHLSCYALTVEEKTPLDYFIKKGKVPPIDEAMQAEHFEILLNQVCNTGYEQYEISNFALPGMESKHNSHYWSGQPYFGFGPSAHSFNGKHTRWWNIANNALYITAINKSLPFSEKEELSIVQRLNERIMTGIRTSKGLAWAPDRNIIAGTALLPNHIKKITHRIIYWQQNGCMIEQDGYLILTKKGKFFADGIASDLFVD